MYFSKKKSDLSFSHNMSFKLFEAIQTAFFYKKNPFKMFKWNLFMFLDLQVSKYQNKKKGEGKFTVERWLQKIDRVDCLDC